MSGACSEKTISISTKWGSALKERWPQEWNKTETQQWLVDTVMYKHDNYNTRKGIITVTVPWGVSSKNLHLLVSHLLDLYPGRVECFSPRKGRYVTLEEPPASVRRVFKISLQ